MSNDTCCVDGCDRPVKRKSLCYAHYMKNWRYGTPTPEHPPTWVDLRGQRFGTLVVQVRVGSKWSCLCDCGDSRLVSAGELNRTGERNTCGADGRHLSGDVGYTAAHDRCRRVHGPIREHVCVDCGKQARHWSYNHDDPDELLAHGLSARPVAYSVDPAHYSPRCVPCHKRFDLGRKDALHGRTVSPRPPRGSAVPAGARSAG